MTGSGTALLVTETSASRVTGVDDAPSAPSASSGDAALAVLSMLAPSARSLAVVATTSTTTVSPTASARTGATPTSQLMVPAASAQSAVPEITLTDWKTTSLGRVSVRVTPDAADGPSLVKVSVQVMSSPATTGDGEALLVSMRPASRSMVDTAAASLLSRFGSVPS